MPEIVKFLFIDAVWTGTDRDACLESVQHRELGACWPFVWERLPYFIYGSYPIPERWRVDCVLRDAGGRHRLAAVAQRAAARSRRDLFLRRLADRVLSSC